MPFEALAKKGRVAIDETDATRMRKLSEKGFGGLFDPR
jgi:hypothetical protein